MAALNQELLAWEHTYNTIRPHQALGYLTPLSSSLKERRPSVTHLLDEYTGLTIPAPYPTIGRAFCQRS